jgi:WD40 repeat protein
MHNERDLLVRIVLPELKERCRSRRIHLIDVDLRWGVSESDAQDGKALDICLDEIDSCRPYFLGLLAHRYGWIPPGHNHSITAQEIYHGVLNNEMPAQVVDLRRIIEGRLEGKSLTAEQIDCLKRCYHWDADKNKYILAAEVKDRDREMIRSIFRDFSIYQRDRSFFFFRSEPFTAKLAGDNREDFFEASLDNQKKLATLKQNIMAAGLPCYEYGDIEQFGQQVLEALWKRIEAELGGPAEEAEERDWLEEEAEFHELFIADRTRRFVGRQDILNRLHSFVEAEGETSVMLITGEPGCGKSALMGRFTNDVMRRNPDWLVIPHMVGASSASTNLRQALRRWCMLLSRSLDAPEEIPDDIKELLRYFADVLHRAAQNRRVLLILDAANQFEQIDDAYQMRWLPQQLPDNVRCVISMLPGEAYDSLIVRRSAPVVEQVTGLVDREIHELMKEYLQEIRHEFPNKQIEETFFEKVRSGNPLYILVALEELRVFSQFEKLETRVAKLPDTVPQLFDQVLERIESDLNQALVRDCMSFIACGRHGMTAEELQELLKHHAPEKNAQKLPDMLWARLCRSFSGYLIHRSDAIDFFHQQLKDAVLKRYLESQDESNSTHIQIANYFERRLRDSYLRALEELPYQRTEAEQWGEVEKILTDIRFVEQKCAAGMTYSLLSDYQYVLNRIPEMQEEIRLNLERDRRISSYIEALLTYSATWNKIRARYNSDPTNNPLPESLGIAFPELPPSIRIWSDEEVKQETQRILSHPTRLDRIRAFYHFVNSESSNLSNYAASKGFCIQQAINFAENGPVAENVLHIPQSERYTLLRRSPRPSYQPYPALLRTLEGHTDSVTAVAITADGKLAISASSDKTIRIWNIETGRCLKTLSGHDEEITVLRLSLDGLRIISGSADKMIRIWEVLSGRCQKIIQGQNNPIQALEITPDGKRAVTADGTLCRIWDLESGRCIQSHRFHQDTSLLFSSFAKTYEERQRLKEESYLQVHDIVLCADGKGFSRDSKDRIEEWDMDVGKHFIEQRKVKSVSIYGHDSYNLETERLLFVGTPDGKRKIQAKGKFLEYISFKDDNRHDDRITALDITADGRLVITASKDKTIRIWDLNEKMCIKVLKGHTKAVQTIAITPDGRYAVSGGEDLTVRFWSLEKAENQKMHQNHSSMVSCVKIKKDGKQVVSGSADSIRLWNTKNGKCVQTFSNSSEIYKELNIYNPYEIILDMAFTRNEMQLGVAQFGEKEIRIWALKIGKRIKNFKGHTEPANAICFTPDESRAISSSHDKTLRIWDTINDRCLNVIEAHSDIISTVKIALDGKRMVSASFDKSIKLWDLESGQNLRTLLGHKGKIFLLALTPDTRCAIAVSSELSLRVWNLENGHCLQEISDQAYFALSPCGRFLASVCKDNKIKVWDIRNGQIQHILPGHTRMITGITMNQDGHWIVSGGLDHTLRIWDAKTGESCALTCQSITFFRPFPTLQVLAMKNHYIAGGDNAGNVFFYEIISSQKNLPFITAVRLYNFNSKIWEQNITATCEWCGVQFNVESSILQTIAGIIKCSNLSPAESPCLQLPDDAWEEPGLFSECPSCHARIRFNPFIVDNRERC